MLNSIKMRSISYLLAVLFITTLLTVGQAFAEGSFAKNGDELVFTAATSATNNITLSWIDDVDGYLIELHDAGDTVYGSNLINCYHVDNYTTKCRLYNNGSGSLYKSVRLELGDGGDTFNGTDTTHSEPITVNAGSGSDTLNGGDASEVLNGEGDSDLIAAGAGNDTVDGGDSFDTLDGGDGSDTVSYGTSIAAVTVDLAASTTSSDTSITGFESVVGSNFGDTLSGSSVANGIDGGSGDDVIDASIDSIGEVDSVDCGAGSLDTVTYNLGIDTVVNCENDLTNTGSNGDTGEENPPPPTIDPPVAETAPIFTLAKSSSKKLKLKAKRSKKVTFKATCSTAGWSSKISAKVRITRSGKRAKTISLGSKTLALTAAETTYSGTFKLSKTRVKKILRLLSKRRTKATLYLVAAPVGPTGSTALDTKSVTTVKHRLYR